MLFKTCDKQIDKFRRGDRGSTGGIFDWRLIADY